MMFDNLAAVQSLRPKAEFIWKNGDIIWLDKNQTQPTEEEIQAEIVRLQADYDSKQYQRNRQPEYPDMADLADALYWSSKGDNTKLDAYYAACEAVKTKYPKP
tara:strand:+ start:2090 stop:2398 length:309 start_codon:yes stop_codon:yes gene_type:complete